MATSDKAYPCGKNLERKARGIIDWYDEVEEEDLTSPKRVETLVDSENYSYRVVKPAEWEDEEKDVLYSHCSVLRDSIL